MEESAVLIIFFNRPDTLQLVFNEVRKAKPKVLYLFQDGPRNEKDNEKIDECRLVVEKIDWDCRVERFYCSENNGCGRGPQKAINWIFQNEEKAIILEDDCVPSVSFFDFCNEMLERYKADSRIFLITGCNLELKSNVNTSYFFGTSGTNWGWATWKRNWDKMDFACSWTRDNYLMKNLYHLNSRRDGKRKAKAEISLFRRTFDEVVNRKHNISYWDVQFQAVRYLNNQLSIIPSCNLITNIGVGEMSTHANGIINSGQLNEKIGKINAHNNKRFELAFPLVHPEYVINNVEYDDKLAQLNYPIAIKKLFMAIKWRIRKALY